MSTEDLNQKSDTQLVPGKIGLYLILLLLRDVNDMNQVNL